MFFYNVLKGLRNTIDKIQRREPFEERIIRYVSDFFEEAEAKIHPEIVIILSAGLLVALLANTITSFRVFDNNPTVDVLTSYWFIFLFLTALLMVPYCFGTFCMLLVFKHFYHNNKGDMSGSRLISSRRPIRLAIISTIFFLIFLMIASCVWSLKDMYDAQIVLSKVHFVGNIQILFVLLTYLIWLIPYSLPFLEIILLKWLIADRSYKWT
jgi:hypothetical protein